MITFVSALWTSSLTSYFYHSCTGNEAAPGWLLSTDFRWQRIRPNRLSHVQHFPPLSFHYLLPLGVLGTFHDWFEMMSRPPRLSRVITAHLEDSFCEAGEGFCSAVVAGGCCTSVVQLRSWWTAWQEQRVGWRDGIWCRKGWKGGFWVFCNRVSWGDLKLTARSPVFSEISYKDFSPQTHGICFLSLLVFISFSSDTSYCLMNL